ncbi:hypothetical protein [Bradyrhizobium valentinum]|uniref:hypothetical protein n=1 Tax=Bradyrhizobium valentinum TaxID=1518501 RepID=UPI000B2E43DF|nr:hypothetical protein [Bradyrhizobium valentinum]
MSRNSNAACSTRLKNTGAAIALMIFSLSPGVAFAAGEGCMASYYRSKSPACIDDTLAQLRQTAASGRAEPNTIIGFLGELFRSSPQERERLLKAETSNYVKSIDVVSLYRAGLPDEAQRFAAANDLSGLSDRLRAARMPPLEVVTPSSTPGDNDLLIGAYMASGNTAHIRRILDNYSSADDGMAGDGLRVGFMMSKFGPGLAPKGRDSVMAKVACTKYDCKANQAKFLRVITLGTAMWSLQSLSAQDDGIKKTLSEFFSRDARLKSLFAVEQAAFGNYMTAILLVATFKDKRTGEDQDRTYELMNKSASIYENLGSGKDAFEPFQNLKK